MVMSPNGGYPNSSDTNSTASGPTGKAPDVSKPGTPKAPDNGSAPPASPRAASNADQVTPHQTSCSGDAGLENAISNATKMHEGQ